MISYDAMKYVIVEWNGLELPILCAYPIEHFQMVHNVKVVAAGFARIEPICNCGPDGTERDFEVNCSGASVSLDKKSRGPIDAEIILRELRRGAYLL